MLDVIFGKPKVSIALATMFSTFSTICFVNERLRHRYHDYEAKIEKVVVIHILLSMYGHVGK